MKTRKTIWKAALCTVFVVLAACLLCACGQKTPGKQRIKEDLGSLKKYSALKITDVSITLSDSSEKGSYLTHFSFEAKDAFAKYKGTGKFSYKRYDQGWELSSKSTEIIDITITDWSRINKQLVVSQMNTGSGWFATNYTETYDVKIESIDSKQMKVTFWFDSASPSTFELDYRDMWIADGEEAYGISYYGNEGLDVSAAIGFHYGESDHSFYLALDYLTFVPADKNG